MAAALSTAESRARTLLNKGRAPRAPVGDGVLVASTVLVGAGVAVEVAGMVLEGAGVEVAAAA